MSGLWNLTEEPCTLEYVLERCRKELDCWTWAGVKRDERWPILFLRRVDANTGRIKNHQVYVRHLVLWLVKGKRPSLGRTKCVTTTCGNEQCVNPAHLKVTTRSEVNKRSRQSYTLTARVNMAKSRRKNSKLSDEDVRRIRESEESNKAVAAKYGITHQYVAMIRNNQWRREYSSPFAGLGAL